MRDEQMKFVHVTGGHRDRADVEQYLPGNFRIGLELDGGKEFLIEGKDDHGWTAQEYVVPRLRSGLIACQVVGTLEAGSLMTEESQRFMKDHISLIHVGFGDKE